MLNVHDWFTEYGSRDRPWLVIGKGPSFGLRDRIDLNAYSTISLNHVVTQQPVFISHIIDMDVVDDCRDVLAKNAEWLLMPFHPHVHCRASGLSLTDFVPTVPVLEDFDRRGRLLWYNLHSGQPEAPLSRSPWDVQRFCRGESVRPAGRERGAFTGRGWGQPLQRPVQSSC